MVAVLLEILSVLLKDVGVHDGQDTSPALVALGEVILLDVKDVVEKGKVVLDLLVSLNVETLGRLRHGGTHVGHVEWDRRGRMLKKKASGLLEGAVQRGRDEKVVQGRCQGVGACGR